MLLPQLEFGDAGRFFLYVAGVASWAHAAGEFAWRDVVVEDLASLLVEIDRSRQPGISVRAYN